MIDIVNYAPRMKLPVLMLNGRFDPLFPYQQSQRRLFELLGTPPDRKAHIVYDAGHLEFPPNTLARDVSNWFDKYLGAVR
jgi:pimeloyl-ACP methyl ester carboxylesterase